MGNNNHVCPGPVCSPPSHHPLQWNHNLLLVFLSIWFFTPLLTWPSSEEVALHLRLQRIKHCESSTRPSSKVFSPAVFLMHQPTEKLQFSDFVFDIFFPLCQTSFWWGLLIKGSGYVLGFTRQFFLLHPTFERTVFVGCQVSVEHCLRLRFHSQLMQPWANPTLGADWSLLFKPILVGMWGGEWSDGSFCEAKCNLRIQWQRVPVYLIFKKLS